LEAVKKPEGLDEGTVLYANHGAIVILNDES